MKYELEDCRMWIKKSSEYVIVSFRETIPVKKYTPDELFDIVSNKIIPLQDEMSILSISFDELLGDFWSSIHCGKLMHISEYMDDFGINDIIKSILKSESLYTVDEIRDVLKILLRVKCETESDKRKESFLIDRIIEYYNRENTEHKIE